MTAAGRRLQWLWLIAATIFITVIFLRLELSFDLSAFVPRQTSLPNEILIEQIERGSASRLLVIGIGGASREILADVSDRLKVELSRSPAFVAVMNGQFDLESASVPEPVNSYFLLMRDLDYGVDSLRSALDDRVRDLAIGGGSTLRELIARDPFLVSLDILDQLTAADISGDMWFAEDGSAVLIVETLATSIDIEAQREAVEAVKAAFDELRDNQDLALDITGVGAFSVELQETIRAEATLRSILASVTLMLVILVIFRRPRYVLLAAIPLGMGFLAGLALVSMLFDKVHGITLAFGFTMLGVAMDYPLHLFSHAQSSSGQVAIRRIWPTLILGVSSTAVAYFGLIFSGSEGLAQLGSFTVTGIVIAVLVTRTWLPEMVSGVDDTASTEITPEASPYLGWAIGFVVLIVASAVAVTTNTTGLWDDKLSSLSPIAPERLSADHRLRSAAATPDMRYQLVFNDSLLQTILENCERLEPLLLQAKVDGLIDDWQSVCQLLPSQAVQEKRRALIPEPSILRERIRIAADGTPFRAEAFDPFVTHASAARQFGTLDPAQLSNTPLRSWLDAHLVKLGTEWVALVSLVEPRHEFLETRIAEWPTTVRLVDFQNASVELMQDYRKGALRVIATAALLILALIWLVRGELRQMVWVGLTVAAAVATTIMITSIAHGGLTVIHLVASLLVLGLGLDYALFLSRAETTSEQAKSRKGVFACAASTTAAFGILAGSSIPVLKYLGLTVATGSAASYLLAYLGSRGWRQTSS